MSESNGQPSAADLARTGTSALARAVTITSDAATLGFDWPSVEPVFDKVLEELEELREAREELLVGGPVDHVFHELGDLLFAVANLARKLELDPEAALVGCNARFGRRFSFIEQSLRRENRGMEDASLEEMDQLWEKAKRVLEHR